MKLAFSTVGCPDFQWSEIYSMAKDLGFDGIEVRGLGKEISTFNMQPFQRGRSTERSGPLRICDYPFPAYPAASR